jgi:hypothetical protein
VAYGYLSESAAAFHGEALNNILRKIGFIDVIALPQTFGVATIYSKKLILRNIQPKHEKNCCLTFTFYARGYSQFKKQHVF